MQNPTSKAVPTNRVYSVLGKLRATRLADLRLPDSEFRNTFFKSSPHTTVDPIRAHKHVIVAVNAAPTCACEGCNPASPRWGKARENTSAFRGHIHDILLALDKSPTHQTQTNARQSQACCLKQVSRTTTREKT